MSVSPVTPRPELVKYQLLDEIGHGGMATVYRARDMRLGREVAVKLIHPHLRENKEVAARFVIEARAAAKLKHPGIVEVFDVSDDDDNERFLVAELVRGPSLRQLLDEHGPLVPEIGACLGVLIADALAHAHNAGIVHRDVKPENVLVELDEERRTVNVKLTDFGIAKVLDAQGMTSTGQVLGSPAHMAPEQIEGGQVDARTDVFSLGVLIYACMVGHLPFEGNNPAQVLRKVLDCSYPPADKERAVVGGRWASILSRAIAREQTDRYPTIRKFGDVMKAELEELGITDLKAELYACLSNGEAYEKKRTPIVIEKLVARAQRARRRRDVRAAAGDLNRAVAYRPDDAELLRMVAALAKGQWRRRVTRRVLWAAACTMLLAFAGFALARAVRAWRSNPIEAISRLPEASSLAVPTQPPSPTSPALTGSAVASNTARPILVTPVIRPTAVAQQTRDVLIQANPQSALVSMDGEAPTPVSFGIKKQGVSVGPHTFVFSVGPNNRCCEDVTEKVEITAGDGPQTVAASLRFRAAIISLANGPPGGTLRCPELGVTLGVGGKELVPMKGPARNASCFFEATGFAPSSTTATLSAGSTKVISWPSAP